MRMFLVVHLALLLAACGSSGGGGSPKPVGAASIECIAMYNEGGASVCSMGSATMAAATVTSLDTGDAVPCDDDPTVLCMDLGVVRQGSPIMVDAVIKNEADTEFRGQLTIIFKMDCGGASFPMMVPTFVISPHGTWTYSAGIGCTGNPPPTPPGDYEADITFLDLTGADPIVRERRIGRYTIIE